MTIDELALKHGTDKSSLDHHYTQFYQKYFDKYISNPEILRNIDKLVDITKYNRILRVAKDFVARRWFMNAKKYNFPIEKCDFYGVIDNRNISKKDWYKSETGINQVMKEFINIGQLTIDKELDIN